MPRPPHRFCLIIALGLGVAMPAASDEGTMCVENATIGELQQALATGTTTAAALVRDYLARIEAYDRAGGRLNAVREVNPEALAIAAALDRDKPTQRRPLEGIPILVTVKPTVGLVSRAGIIPIAHSQDTAGPLTRTVRDAAILLNVLAALDPSDPATEALQRPADYTSVLDRDGLKGARIGVPSDPSDPANDFYYAPLMPRAAVVMREAIAVIEAQGATIVRANIPTEGWIGGPGTEMTILNRNPESPTKHQPARRPIVFVYELKHDLDLYLRDWATGTEMRNLADIVAFNAANADRALRFGQDIFLAAEAARGDLSELEYISARQMDLRASRTLGLDAYIGEHRLDAVLFAAMSGAAIAAKAGYPSIQVPAGFIAGIR